MLSHHVMEHLRAEISKDDPWLLETKAFDQARYATILDMLAESPEYESGLELGCAAGAFTEQLAPARDGSASLKSCRRR
jgi:hypothetical protein